MTAEAFGEIDTSDDNMIDAPELQKVLKKYWENYLQSTLLRY